MLVKFKRAICVGEKFWHRNDVDEVDEKTAKGLVDDGTAAYFIQEECTMLVEPKKRARGRPRKNAVTVENADSRAG